MNDMFCGVNVVDVINGAIHEEVDVEVSGNVIASVQKHLSSHTNAGYDKFRGKYLLPGLVDMHIHMRGWKYSGPAPDNSNPGISTRQGDEGRILSKLHSYLYCGVTTVFDAGNVPDLILKMREREHLNQIVSPRIFCTGNLITSIGGHGSEVAVQMDSLDKAAIGSYLKQKPNLVKITYDEHGWGIRPMISILKKDVLRAITDYIHSKGLKTIVHISNEIRAREAIESGSDILAHPVIQSPVSEDFIKLIHRENKQFVSTLQIGEGYSRLADHPEYLNERIYSDCLDQEERDFLINQERLRQLDNSWAKWMKIMTPIAAENVRRLGQRPDLLLVGTDGTSGPEYFRELELLQQYGVPRSTIIRAATANAYKALGIEKAGRISPGFSADFIIVDGNPLKDIRNLGNVSAVIKNGSFVDLTSLRLPCNSGVR